eukprot:gene2139-2280_t
MFSYYSTKLEVHETLEEIDHFSTNPTQSPHTTQRTSSPALKNSPIRVKTSPTKIFSPLNLHSPPKIEKFTDSDKLKHSIQGSKEFFKRRYNTFIEKPVLSPLVCSLSFLKLSLDRLRSLFDPNNSKSTRSIKVAGYLQIRDAGFEVELLSLCFLLYQCSSGFYEINTNLALTYENHHPNPFTSLSQALLYNLFYRTSDASQRQVSMNSTRTNDNSFIEGFIQLINGSWEFYKLTGSITIPFSVPAAASNKCATYFREDKLDQKSPLFQYLHTKSKTTLNPNNSNPFSIPNPRMTLQLDMQQKLVSEHHPTLLFLPKACSSESDVESFREGDGTEIDDPDKINKCAEESFGMDEIQMNRIRNYSKKIVKIEQLLFTLYDLLLLWYSSSRDVILPSNMEENREETTEFSLREMFDSLKDFLIRWNVDSFNQRYQEFARVAVSSSQGMESPERNQKLKTYSHSISPHTMSTSELIAIIRDKSKEEGDLKLGQNSSLLKRKFEREEKKGVNKTLSKGGKKQRIHVSEEASRKQNPPKLKNKNVIIQQWRKDDKELYDNYADLEDFLVVDQNED